MPLKLMYITNKPSVALIAERSGVDRIFLDLEHLGKVERQGHINSVKSNHTVDDVKRIKQTISVSQLLVRVNPINLCSEQEINDVIDYGADIVMLPMWKTTDEVKQFVTFVNGRARVNLLLETKEADSIISEIVKIPGIDEIHIGLNDLHLSYGKTFMFELLEDGTVERLCKAIGDAKIPYGFGGVARLGEGMLPAQNILAEHYRLGSRMVILSRSFYDSTCKNNIKEIEKVFSEGIKEIREYEQSLSYQDKAFFISNQEEVCGKVKLIADKILANK